MDFDFGRKSFFLCVQKTPFLCYAKEEQNQKAG